MAKNLIILVIFFVTFNIFSQINSEQNGLKSTVTGVFSADATQAKRYEIASVGYNYFHWQTGGIIIIELFQEYYGTGYEKYIIENGYAQNSDVSSTLLKLTDSHGLVHSGVIKLGTPTNLSSSTGDYINKRLPIYLDVRYYARYRVKISYLQQKVDIITDVNQIKIDQNPTGVNIADFGEPSDLNYDLKISGTGNHYIKNGNVGIGTTNPTSMLTVAGNIASREVKVSVDTGADFVFENNYNLPSLESVDKFIKENKHLPEIASAKEMQKDGINLSEMNIKLLQKIEEMTLYMIEMKKEIELLKKNQK
ncbi:hypothetical protein [Flavobacterium sp.]|uniref:hypothetical protein n=1 Tax=Flavobacterium sp. TaxID=239 RepID=UPI003D136417